MNEPERRREFADAFAAQGRSDWLVYQYLAPLQAPPRLRVNPHDLDRLGVGTGGQVRLRAPRRTAVVEVVGDPGLPRGSASLPFNLEGLSAGDLIDVTRSVNDVAIETL